jgi:hypothetical protein
VDDNGLRSATTARGLCRGRVLRAFVVVQPFDGHSSIGSASITGSTTSRALPSASHPCGLLAAACAPAPPQLLDQFPLRIRDGFNTFEFTISL